MADSAGQGGTAPDKPDPAQNKEPPDPAGDAQPEKISDWESEGGSPPKVISSTKSTPPKKPGK
ncbi:MAG: hypothetical protein ABWZ78_05520 [Burkholderiaceae bacterium]